MWRQGGRCLERRDSPRQSRPGPGLRPALASRTRPHLLTGMLGSCGKSPPGPQRLAPLLLAGAPGQWTGFANNSTDLQAQQRTAQGEEEGCIVPKPTGVPKILAAENGPPQPGAGQAVCSTHCTATDSASTRSPAGNESPWLILNSHTPQGLTSTLSNASTRYDPSDAMGRSRPASAPTRHGPSQPQNRREPSIYHYAYHPQTAARKTFQEDSGTAPCHRTPCLLNGDSGQAGGAGAQRRPAQGLQARRLIPWPRVPHRGRRSHVSWVVRSIRHAVVDHCQLRGGAIDSGISAPGSESEASTNESKIKPRCNFPFSTLHRASVPRLAICWGEGLQHGRFRCSTLQVGKNGRARHPLAPALLRCRPVMVREARGDGRHQSTSVSRSVAVDRRRCWLRRITSVLIRSALRRRQATGGLLPRTPAVLSLSGHRSPRELARVADPGAASSAFMALISSARGNHPGHEVQASRREGRAKSRGGRPGGGKRASQHPNLQGTQRIP